MQRKFFILDELNTTTKVFTGKIEETLKVSKDVMVKIT